jgi:hypothetical protein
MTWIKGFKNLKNQSQNQTKGSILKRERKREKELELKFKVPLEIKN